MKQYLVAAVALLTACVGEAPSSSASSCEDAAAALDTCSDSQRQAFVSACEEVGGADLVADEASSVCAAVPSDGKADFGSSVAVGACVASMYAVKWGVGALSPSPQPLSDELKTSLRPLYGSLVDRARIVIGASLPPRIKLAGRVLAVEPEAMTFGTDIYMRDTVATDTRTPYELMFTAVHEMTHVKQAQQAGGYYGFALAYCRDVVASGFDYNHIQMEAEAYGVEGTARTNVLRGCGKIVCP